MTTPTTKNVLIPTAFASALGLNQPFGPLSPLSSESRALTPDEKKEGLKSGLLDQSGTLAPDLQALAGILNDPAVEIRSAFRSWNETLLLHVYSDSHGSIVGYTPLSGSQFRLQSPVESDQLAAILIGGLGMNLPTPDPGFRGDISLEALWTLAGIVDAMREEQLQTLLAHKEEKSLFCRKDRILANIYQGVVSSDSRWLCALLNFVSPVDTVMTDKSVDRGLQELAVQDWIQTHQDGVCSFSQVWEPVLISLGFCVGAGILAIRRKTETGISAFQVAVIRAMGNLWSLDFDMTGKNMVSIQTADGLSLSRAVDILIQNALTAETAPPAQTQTPPSLSSARPVIAEKKFCTQCGNKLEAGSKFCPSCGAKV